MSQLSMSHQLLPKEEWTKPEEVQLLLRMDLSDANRRQDVPYLSPLITDIEAEMAEREDFETMIVQKRQKNAASGH